MYTVSEKDYLSIKVEWEDVPVLKEIAECFYIKNKGKSNKYTELARLIMEQTKDALKK